KSELFRPHQLFLPAPCVDGNFIGPNGDADVHPSPDLGMDITSTYRKPEFGPSPVSRNRLDPPQDRTYAKATSSKKIPPTNIDLSHREWLRLRNAECLYHLRRVQMKIRKNSGFQPLA
ncbi:hypothetical protein H257_18801, partial [Aphanomyces astaci]